MVVRAALLTLTLFASPALAQPAKDSFARMLQAVPAPTSAERLLTATPVLAYIRLDLLAGAPGPTVKPGTARLRAWGYAQMPALGVAGMLGTVPLADAWPATIGFDLDAVDAVLTVPAAGGSLPTSTLRVLAGAPRLHDAAHIGDALRRRGFTQEDVGRTTVFSVGEDNQISPARRTRGDPFEAGVGQAQRIAVTPAGLLVSSETGVMRRALDTLTGHARSLADLDAMRAVVAGCSGTEVMQAIVVSSTAGLSVAVTPPPPFAQPRLPPGTGGPPLPQWDMAALAELAAPPGKPHHRVVLVLPHPEAARAALQARIEAATSGARPLAIASIALRVLPERFNGLGVLVADLHMLSGKGSMAMPLSRWWTDMKLGVSTPITFDTTARSPP